MPLEEGEEKKHLILDEIIYLIVPLIVSSTWQLGSIKPRWVGCIGTSSPKHIANKNINKILFEKICYLC
jgi:hypothetical protein